MKTTTVRFGADLWRLLEHEAAGVGVSVSQYLREAALARAAAAAAARGDAPLALLAGAIDEVTADRPAATRHPAQRALAALAQALAQEQAEETPTR